MKNLGHLIIKQKCIINEPRNKKSTVRPGEVSYSFNIKQIFYAFFLTSEIIHPM